MHLLIREAVVIDPSSSFHRKRVDIRIQEGIITQIGPELPVEDAEILPANDAFVSPGWFDMGVQACDPGFEHREDLNSVRAAAAAGGYTGIAVFPNTQPVLDSKSGVEYIRQRTSGGLVDVYPIGAVSQNCEGRDITEMLDMRAAGALAFSDGSRPVQHAGLLLRALLYVKSFGGLVLNRPLEDSIAGGGQMHEGYISTSLGLKGIPTLAEEIMVTRDIYLAEYTDSRIHLHNISCARSVELIRAAKARGIKVTASVPVLNLLMTDEALAGFDTNFKVLPPLRSKVDREALLEGLADGTIDCLSSNHVPLEEETKKLEFPYAKFGSIGLETAFAVTCTALQKQFTPEQWVEKAAVAPRNLLGLAIPSITENAPANLTLFDPAVPWTFGAGDIRSKSGNTSLIGKEFQGKVLGVINNRRWEILQ